jgi:quercetin dioxygenase-like cupin family protein
MIARERINEMAQMTEKAREPWPWPPELDAMTAAPEYHDLLFENEHVRVLNAHVGPGETVPVHTHCWPGVLYILGTSDFVRRDPDGNVLVDTRGTPQAPPGSSVWGNPLTPHSLHNVGTTELRNITV